MDDFALPVTRYALRGARHLILEIRVCADSPAEWIFYGWTTIIGASSTLTTNASWLDAAVPPVKR
jgi:hypothetical protein